MLSVKCFQKWAVSSILLLCMASSYLPKEDNQMKITIISIFAKPPEDKTLLKINMFYILFQIQYLSENWIETQEPP